MRRRVSTAPERPHFAGPRRTERLQRIGPQKVGNMPAADARIQTDSFDRESRARLAPPTRVRAAQERSQLAAVRHTRTTANVHE